jgi:hypothetical protein
MMKTGVTVAPTAIVKPSSSGTPQKSIAGTAIKNHSQKKP